MNKQLRTVAKIVSLTIAVILAVVLAVEEKNDATTLQSEAVSSERTTTPTELPATPTQMPTLKQEPTSTVTDTPTPIMDDFTVITGDVEIPQVTEQITQVIEKKSSPVPEQTKEQAEEPYTEDIKLLAEVIYHENWHTDKEKKTAYWTGAVVLNRVKSDRWPNTIREVLYQKNPKQYSTTHKFFTVELPEECYEMARSIIENGTPDVPENVVYQSQFKQGSGVWEELNGEYFCYE